MKTKVIITIEVEEYKEDTELLIERIRNNNLLTVSDVFDPQEKLHFVSINNSYTAVSPDTLEEPKPAEIKTMMYTRGIKI